MVVATVGLHFIWEMAQSGFFTDFTGQRWWQHALRCLGAAVGDLLISVFAYVLAAVLWSRWRWPFESRSAGPVVIWLAAGELATVALERWAITVGRWSYANQMPTVLGVGLLPVLQWLIVPLLALLVTRRVAC